MLEFQDFQFLNIIHSKKDLDRCTFVKARFVNECLKIAISATFGDLMVKFDRSTPIDCS